MCNHITVVKELILYFHLCFKYAETTFITIAAGKMNKLLLLALLQCCVLKKWSLVVSLVISTFNTMNFDI